MKDFSKMSTDFQEKLHVMNIHINDLITVDFFLAIRVGTGSLDLCWAIIRGGEMNSLSVTCSDEP